MEGYLLIGMIVLGLGILVISLCQKKMEMFINFILRLVAGVVGIYVTNSLLSVFSISGIVGLNCLNILVVSLLGVPGFILIYGLGFYFLL